MPTDKKLVTVASTPGTVTKYCFHFILRFNLVSQLDRTWSHSAVSTSVVGFEQTCVEHIVHQQRCGKLQAVCLTSNAFKDGIGTNKMWLKLVVALQVQVLCAQHDLIANLKLHSRVFCIIITCLGLLYLTKCSLCISHKSLWVTKS